MRSNNALIYVNTVSVVAVVSSCTATVVRTRSVDAVCENRAGVDAVATFIYIKT